jgi:Chemoreceptor zinc-binding domain
MKKLVDKLDEMEKQHKDWLDALEQSLKDNVPFTKALDPNKCAFGIWYNKFKTDNEELNEVLQRFDAPHKRLHGLAAKLLELNKSNHEQALKILSEERMGTLAELIHLFHLTKERAQSSIRPIIIFVEHNEGKVTALRLDNINDIVTFDQKNFCLDDSSDGILKHKNADFVVEGFLRDGDRAPLMLINCQAFSSAKNKKEQVA